MQTDIGNVDSNIGTDETAPLLVELPNELADFFGASGYSGDADSEARVTSRLSARCGTTIQFTYSPLPLLNAVCDPPTIATVLLKDLSKTGVAVLFHRQIYPGECATIRLHGRELRVVFQRCRRLGSMCFEAGAVVKTVESVEKN